MRLETSEKGKSLLTSLLLWTQDEEQYPVIPERWCGLLSTSIFMDLCAGTGPALEVEEPTFASMYSAVRDYSKYEEWSEAELYLACKSLAVNRLLVDIYEPALDTPVVQKILAKFYSAMANSDRLKIVLLLQGAGNLLSVSEIAECLGCSDKMQSIRRHLRILYDVRIVERHWEDGAGRYQFDERAILANLELTQETVL